MIGWLVVVAANVLFWGALAGLVRAAVRPWSEVDQRCSDCDEALDAQYGGWRNRA